MAGAQVRRGPDGEVMIQLWLDAEEARALARMYGEGDGAYRELVDAADEVDRYYALPRPSEATR